MSINHQIEITQQIIETLVSNNNIEITPDLLISGGTSDTLFEITTDIEIKENMILKNVCNVKVVNHNITIEGELLNCDNWNIISSDISNNGNIRDYNEWKLLSSNISNNEEIYNCIGWNIINSDLTNKDTFEYNNSWVLMFSKITNDGVIVDCDFLNLIISEIKNINLIFECKNWFFISSDITESGTKIECNDWREIKYYDFPLIKKEDYDILQQYLTITQTQLITTKSELNKLKDTVVHDKSLSKLFLHMYSNQKKNNLNVFINVVNMFRDLTD